MSGERPVMECFVSVGVVVRNDRELLSERLAALEEGLRRSFSDFEILVIDRDNCVLYEIYDAYPRNGGGWDAGSGAIFDLTSNARRPSLFIVARRPPGGTAQAAPPWLRPS